MRPLLGEDDKQMDDDYIQTLTFVNIETVKRRNC